jgi:hypothetical protein
MAVRIRLSNEACETVRMTDPDKRRVALPDLEKRGGWQGTGNPGTPTSLMKPQVVPIQPRQLTNPSQPPTPPVDRRDR